MSRISLFHGDCLQVMKDIPDGTVDMILCDLPYGTTQCSWDAIIPFAPLWEQYRRLAKPNAAIVLCSAQPFTSYLVASNVQAYRTEWIWEKGNATGFLNAKKQPLRAHENIVVFYDQQPTYNPQITSGHTRKTAKKKPVSYECYGKSLTTSEYDSTERYPRDVQFFASDKQFENLHPTQKPVALMEYLIRTYSHPGDTVLDNCMGSGSTGVACLNTGRNFIGIELQKEYFDVARERLASSRGPLFRMEAAE